MHIILRLLLGLVLGLLPLHAADNILRPDQLKPGQKGYGLSVFRGTAPERFEVEILGVLPNALPKQDMILIRMARANLEKHKIIAGMSGSPVYIEDKLIGAIAYGWSFPNEPIAGVTPIHNMLAERDKKPGPAPAAPLPAHDNYGTARPLLTPLALGGFSPRTIDRFAADFERWGFVPVASGGSSTTGQRRGAGRYVPGGAIGVQLIRGDLNATGVGTVSYVDRDRVLAFGHPMFQIGRVLAPTVEAEVHTIMSSVARSFKLASPVAELGALVGDWQSCIVVDPQGRAPMIPLHVDVTNPDSGDRQAYRLEIVDSAALSAFFAMISVAEVVGGASSSSRDTTVRVNLEAELAEPARTLKLANTYFHPGGGLVSLEMLHPIAGLFHSPFGDPRVRQIHLTVTATERRQTATIKRAYFAKAEVERGERLPLHIVLEPHGAAPVTKTVEITVPAAGDQPQLLLSVLAGNQAPADIALPVSLGDYLDAFEKKHRSTDLVILQPTPAPGLQHRGQLLKKLPASVADVLDDDGVTGLNIVASTQQIIVPTDWVLTGQAFVRVPIRKE
jgi:hypothetical protein